MANILVLSEIFPPTHGGSGRWFFELYRRLTEHDITIVTTEVEGQTASDFPHAVIHQPMRSWQWGVLHPQGLWFYLKQIWALCKLCRKHHITQIHAGRVLHEGLTAAIVALILKTKLVVFVHGEDVETTAVSREHDALAKFVFRRADLVICNSHNSARILKRLSYADDARVEVHHPGADMTRYQPAPENLAFRQTHGWTGKQVLLTVGRLQARKGQDYLIQALPTLLQSHPNLLYVIVGSGDDLMRLQRLVDEHQLAEHVQFWPDASDDDLLHCYQQCDIFILPNRTIDNDIEGFGMVLVEAQACGKPVVAGNSGGTKETMIEGETGFVIDCSDKQSIVTELSPLLANKDLAAIGTQGVSFVHERFAWDVHAALLQTRFSNELQHSENHEEYCNRT